LAISLNEFKNVGLKVAKILAVEDVPGKDKLYKMQIDLGTEKRQIVAGIKSFYSKEKLVGKQIVIVSNLEPARIAGIESNGMLLASKTPDGKYALVTLDEEVDPGTPAE
jgi:methionyl-tRNA synthetase